MKGVQADLKGFKAAYPGGPSHTHSHSHTLTLKHSHTTHTLTVTLLLTLTLTLALSLSFSFSFSLTEMNWNKVDAELPAPSDGQTQLQHALHRLFSHTPSSTTTSTTTIHTTNTNTTDIYSNTTNAANTDILTNTNTDANHINTDTHTLTHIIPSPLLNYKHPELVHSSGWKMELDIFYPTLKIAFEFNGRQHYQDSFRGNLHLQRSRDTEKKVACESLNITLVSVPYWWDRSLTSLAATIKGERPDITFPGFRDVDIAQFAPIPSVPPSLLRKRTKVDVDPTAEFIRMSQYPQFVNPIDRYYFCCCYYN